MVVVGPDMLKWAERYLALGYRPIPCQAHGKNALVQWADYQERPPSLDEVRGWWSNWPIANIALTTGTGLVVLDLDGPRCVELLDAAGIVLPHDAPRVQTGRGAHIYLSYPDGAVPNRIALLRDNGEPPSQIDVRGDGGYVVVPPSMHENGTQYRWLKTPSADGIPRVPDALLELIRADTAREGAQARWIGEALRGVGQGQRNDTCARLAGYFVARSLPLDVTREMLMLWGERCDPPLSPSEIEVTLQSILRANARKGPVEEGASHNGNGNGKGNGHVYEKITRRLVRLDECAALLDQQLAARRVGIITTPYPDLDELLAGGFVPGELIYLGARPGIGKTLFALEVATDAAKHGHPTLFVTREMSIASLFQRLLAQEGSLSATELRRYGLAARGARETERMIRDKPLVFAENCRTLADIEDSIDDLGGVVSFVVIDYLQLLQPPPDIRDRRIQVDYLSQGLKAMALGRNLPVLCLSSLSRAAATNEGPTMAHLRESGGLEHDADIVMLMHRQRDGSGQGFLPAIELRVEKSRNSQTGLVKLHLDDITLAIMDAADNVRGPDETGGGRSPYRD